jgi:hypothetical protein
MAQADAAHNGAGAQGSGDDQLWELVLRTYAEEACP